MQQQRTCATLTPPMGWTLNCTNSGFISSCDHLSLSDPPMILPFLFPLSHTTPTLVPFTLPPCSIHLHSHTHTLNHRLLISSPFISPVMVPVTTFFFTHQIASLVAFVSLLIHIQSLIPPPPPLDFINHSLVHFSPTNLCLNSSPQFWSDSLSILSPEGHNPNLLTFPFPPQMLLELPGSSSILSFILIPLVIWHLPWMLNWKRCTELKPTLWEYHQLYC